MFEKPNIDEVFGAIDEDEDMKSDNEEDESDDEENQASKDRKHRIDIMRTYALN